MPLFRAVFCGLCLVAASAFAQTTPTVVLQPFVSSGLTNVVEIVNAKDGSNRLFIVEQNGRVRVVQNGQLLAAPMLDVSTKVACCGEGGLLGLAFAPNYATSGRFFIYYTRANAQGQGELVIARYQRSSSNPNLADPATEQIIIVIPHPDFGNHNGGKIAFGPDGYLYAGIGDGGGGGDPFKAGQNLGDLRGKILRIDVSGSGYTIPPTNPFATVGAPTRGEIWHYGLRNPWRFSFDRITGEMFIGDVGQNAWEEISYAPAGTGGLNYGWSVYEGTRCYAATTCSLPNHTPPILEYPHDSTGGFSVTGGYVYRGSAVPSLTGKYIYGDFVSGRIWAATRSGNTWSTVVIANQSSLSTFGEDESGELYVASLGGTITKIVAGDIFTNADTFVRQQYRDFLNREATNAEATAGVNAINAGQSRPAFIEALIKSPAYEDLGGPVTRLYSAYFLRFPDVQGYDFWVDAYRVNNPWTFIGISNFFATSPEFTQRYGSLNNAQFVDLIYQNVLGRAPDPTGRAFWIDELNSGRRSRGQVMADFSESPENKAATRGRVQLTAVTEDMVKRVPTTAEINQWLPAVQSGGSIQPLITTIYNSAEYRARFP